MCEQLNIFLLFNNISRLPVTIHDSFNPCEMKSWQNLMLLLCLCSMALSKPRLRLQIRFPRLAHDPAVVLTIIARGFRRENISLCCASHAQSKFTSTKLLFSNVQKAWWFLRIRVFGKPADVLTFCFLLGGVLLVV